MFFDGIVPSKRKIMWQISNFVYYCITISRYKKLNMSIVAYVYDVVLLFSLLWYCIVINGLLSIYI